MMTSHDRFFDLYRFGLKASGDVIKASLEGAERLRKQQLAAIDEALGSHAQVVAEVDRAKGMDELIAVPAKLASIQFQAVIGYWNSIYQVVGESQADVTKRLQAQTEQVREKLQSSLVAAPGVSVPVMAVLQPLMDVASSAYALTVRAAEDAAKLSAGQLANTNAGVERTAEEPVQRRKRSA